VSLARNTNHNGHDPTKDPSTIHRLCVTPMIHVYPHLHKLLPCTQSGQADINSNRTGYLVLPMRRCQVDARCPHHIEGVHDLGGQLIPQLEWKVAVCCGKGHNESIIERLDHPFRGVDAVELREWVLSYVEVWYSRIM
jgi:hypothetical protein